MEEAKKTGMSKGCMVALIIGASLILILIIGVLAFWYFKDDAAKMVGTQMLNNVKAQIAEGQDPEIDTAQFNAVADSFITILKQDEPFDLQGFGQFIVKTQKQGTASEIDAQDVQTVMDAMLEFYPDLEGMLPPAEDAEDAEEESAGALEDTPESP